VFAGLLSLEHHYVRRRGCWHQPL